MRCGVPCFNKTAHIDAIIGGVQKHLPKNIFVDDGLTGQLVSEEYLQPANWWLSE